MVTLVPPAVPPRVGCTEITSAVWFIWYVYAASFPFVMPAMVITTLHTTVVSTVPAVNEKQINRYF